MPKKEMPVDFEVYALWIIYGRKWMRRGRLHADRYMAPILEKIAERGYRWVTCFSWAYQGMYKVIVPFDPTTWRQVPEFYKAQRHFTKLLTEYGLCVKWITYSRYHWWLFERNDLDPLGPDALRMLRMNIKKTYRNMRVQYPDEALRVQPGNEFPRGGHDLGFRIMHLTEFIFETAAITADVKIEDVDCDITLTDFAKLENPGVRFWWTFNDGGVTRSIDMIEDERDLAKYQNDPRTISLKITDRWGDEDFDHYATLKKNGMNQWTMDAELRETGGWRFFLLSQDGNSMGDGHRVPGFPHDDGWRDLSDEQLREFYRKAYAHPKVKRIGQFPMRIFVEKNNDLYEDLSLLDWDREWIPKQIWDEHTAPDPA